MGKEDGVSIFQLFRYADGADKLLVLLGILGSIGDGLMTPISMYILGNVINDYGTKPVDASFADRFVNKHALILLYVAIGVGLSAFVEGFCWTRTAERQTSRMRLEYLKSVLRQDVAFFDNQDTSSTTSQVVATISSEAHSIQDVLGEKIPNFLAQLSAWAGYLVVCFALSWRLTLAALPFSFMFILPVVIFGKVLMGQAMQMKDAYGVAGGIAEQAISSIRTVFSYVAERQTIEKFSRALQLSMELGTKQGLTKGIMIGSMGILYAVWAFQAWVGSILVINKHEKASAVFIAECCILLGGLSLLSALPNATFFAEATAAASRIFKMISTLPAIDSEDGKGKILAYVRGDIEFKDVDFCYPSRPDTPVLQQFNLKVPAGKTVGLVGGSGSGKSTIISLLERFYDPLNGNIFLDGNKIKRLQLKWLRSQIGLVNQEPVLFATTIKENILFGKEEAPMDLIISAAKAANAHDFITKLPDGYETQVGQFGFQLSGGQKQRIAIARAILRDPRILLLDEATSALDAQSERIVQEALDQASVGRTTIIVAHRLSTIRNANLIVVLQLGKIVESGSHHELMQMNNGAGGEYSKMVQLQQKATQNEPSDQSYYPTPGRKHHRMMNTPSPISIRTSRPSTPVYPFSPAYSLTPTYYSVQSQSSYHGDPGKQDTKQTSYPPPSQWRLMRMNAPEWKQALLGCLGAVGSGALQPVHAYLLGTLISIYLIKDNDHRIKSQTRLYSLIFLGLGVLSFIFSVLQYYNFGIMGERLVKRVREQTLRKLLTFEIGWFDQEENTSAAICSRFATEANLVRSLVADRISLLVQVSVAASLAFALGLVITWRLSIVIIATQPLLIGSFYSRSVLMTSMAEKARAAQNEGSQLASEATINHRTITAFSSQKRILGLYRGTLKDPRKQSIKQSWLAGFGLFSSQFLTTTSIAITYWYGGKLLIKGEVTPKHMFQAFFILLSTGKSIADAGSMTSDLSKGSTAISSVFAIIDRQTQIEPDDPEGLKAKRTIKGNIELKNVFFAYPSRPSQMIFDGLSLKIQAGKTMALVGQSGSGKSTIIGLIERFYDPLKGSVQIDGYDVESYNLRLLRSHIALVSQEPTLFAGTIRENISYGNVNATEAEIKKAAVLANAHEFISSMKDGYETYCGERGVQLSGGQKQRIALARAILKNPAILLLDEATSALDSVSENLVQEALEKMMVGRTCVVVAHRLSTIKKADSIAVIKNGKVVEQGSHSDLLAVGRGGSYYSLIKLQNGASPYR